MHVFPPECGEYINNILECVKWGRVVREHRSPLYQNSFEAMCRATGFEPKVVFRTVDYQSVQGLVAANVGLALIPRLASGFLRPEIVARVIDRPTFNRRIEVAISPESEHAPDARRLFDLLRGAL